MTISNASPIISLAKIKRLDILKIFFSKVYIPLEVYQELVEHPKAPYDQKQEIQKAIDEGGIEVVEVSHRHQFARRSLHSREQGVLNLALEYTPDQIIVDDPKARNEVKDLGLGAQIFLTADVLKYAEEKGLLKFEDMIHLLREQGEILSEE